MTYGEGEAVDSTYVKAVRRTSTSRLKSWANSGVSDQRRAFLLEEIRRREAQAPTEPISRTVSRFGEQRGISETLAYQQAQQPVVKKEPRVLLKRGEKTGNLPPHLYQTQPEYQLVGGEKVYRTTSYQPRSFTSLRRKQQQGQPVFTREEAKELPKERQEEIEVIEETPEGKKVSILKSVPSGRASEIQGGRVLLQRERMTPIEARQREHSLAEAHAMELVLGSEEPSTPRPSLLHLTPTEQADYEMQSLALENDAIVQSFEKRPSDPAFENFNLRSGINTLFWGGVERIDQVLRKAGVEPNKSFLTKEINTARIQNLPSDLFLFTAFSPVMATGGQITRATALTKDTAGVIGATQQVESGLIKSDVLFKTGSGRVGSARGYSAIRNVGDDVIMGDTKVIGLSGKPAGYKLRTLQPVTKDLKFFSGVQRSGTQDVDIALQLQGKQGMKIQSDLGKHFIQLGKGEVKRYSKLPYQKFLGATTQRTTAEDFVSAGAGKITKDTSQSLTRSLTQSGDEMLSLQYLKKVGEPKEQGVTFIKELITKPSQKLEKLKLQSLIDTQSIISAGVVKEVPKVVIGKGGVGVVSALQPSIKQETTIQELKQTDSSIASLNKEIQKTNQIVNLRQATPSKQKFKTLQFTKQTPTQVTPLKTKLEVNQVVKQEGALKQKLNLRQAQAPKQLEKQKTTQRSIPMISIPKFPRVPTEPFIPYIPKVRRVKQQIRQPSYVGQIKRFGTWKSVSVGDLNKVYNQSASRIRQGLGASFRVLSPSGRAVNIGVPKGFYKKGDVRIQKNIFRLGTMGERKEIQYWRRTKGKKRKRKS